MTKTARTVLLTVVGLGLAANGLAQSFPTNGLVAYYPFNGNANDESGNGNNGTLVGTQATTWTNGHSGAGLYFDGVSATYVAVPDSSSLRFPNALTFSAWVRISDLKRDNPIMSKEASGATQLAFYFGCAPSGKFGVLLDGNGVGPWDCVDRANGALIAGEWVHLVSAWDGTNVSHFQNGQLVARNGPFTGPLFASTAFIGIGRNSQANDTEFQGFIDEVRMYNRALSSSEVARLYAFESTPPLGFETNGLVAYYPFNGNANDESGNGANGAQVGAPQLAVDRFGLPNHAYHFDGGTDSIYLPKLGVSTDPNAITTVSFWMRWDGSFYAPSDPGGFPFGWGNSSGVFHYGGAISPPSPPVFGLMGNANAAIFGTYVSSNDLKQWVHVVAKFNNGDVQNGKIFTNGVQVESSVYSSGVPSGGTFQTAVTTNAYISGYGASPNTYRFVGFIDDVRIYNRALSAQEISELYGLESGPRVDLIKAVKPRFSCLWVGTNYQMQVSTDMNNWTDYGSPFTATNSVMVYPQYFDVENWADLFFRLR